MLEEARGACLEIDRVGFSVTRYVLHRDGALEGLELPLYATVRMRDVDVGELGVQFIARGSYYAEHGPDRSRSFVAAWDGRTAELLHSGADVPEHHSGDPRDFLGGLLDLVPPELIAAAPWETALAAAELRFEGLALVSGTPCEAIGVRAPDGAWTHYLIGSADRVVRRIERRRDGVLEVLTITQLNLRPRWNDEAFLIRAATPRPPRQPAGTSELLPTGTPAPAFELVDDRGRNVRLADFAGELLVLHFWTSWSADAGRAVAALQRLHEELGPRGVHVLAACMLARPGGGDPVALLREGGATYSIVPKGEALRAPYKVAEPPALFVIDRAGELLWASSAGFDAHGNEERRLRAVLVAALR